MPIWMSLPSVVIPEASFKDATGETDSLYRRYYRIFLRLFQAFSRPIEVMDEGPLLPRAKSIDAEGLAVSAIKLLLTSQPVRWNPALLVDCRSSAAVGGPAPTYRLAALTGLNTTLPFALDGQGGSELAHALLILRLMDVTLTRGAIVSAIQQVIQPDTRTQQQGFPLGDAAAAIAVTSTPLESAKGFDVLGIAVVQYCHSWESTFEIVLNEALQQASMTKEEISWAVAHRVSDTFLSAAQKCLPGAMWLVRDLYPDVNFGCADVLLSLYCLFAGQPRPSSGNGVALWGGRFGAVAAAVLRLP